MTTDILFLYSISLQCQSRKDLDEILHHEFFFPPLYACGVETVCYTLMSNRTMIEDGWFKIIAVFQDVFYTQGQIYCPSSNHDWDAASADAAYYI